MPLMLRENILRRNLKKLTLDRLTALGNFEYIDSEIYAEI